MPVLTAGDMPPVRLSPNVRRLRLQVPWPLEGRTPNQALRQALQAAGAGRPRLSAVAADGLAAALDRGRGAVTVTLVGRDLVEVAPDPQGDAAAGIPAPLGLAVDVGTTTVAAYLMDLSSGRQLAVASCLNPQAAFGADVISRLTLAITETDGLARLSTAIRGAINELATQACRLAGVSTDRIFELVVVGNTAMHHLLLGIKPDSLAFAPYLPAIVDPVTVPAGDLGLDVARGARVHLLPIIAGYVGADTVGMVLATGLDRARRVSLAVDIGTNGEMVLGDRRRLLACSTAAGPAFEGARISRGMTAAAGAIDRADVVDGELRLHVIGGGAASGICGSGLVDVAAILLRHGLVEPSGRLRAAGAAPAGTPAGLAARLAAGPGGPEFVLQEEAAGVGRVTITQRDIRELQLATGAIRAGITMLIRELGIETGQVRRLYLAGAFGNYLRPESAVAIGLLPRLPLERIVPVGNAAGTGARMALLSVVERRRAARLARRVEYVELAGTGGLSGGLCGQPGLPGVTRRKNHKDGKTRRSTKGGVGYGNTKTRRHKGEETCAMVRRSPHPLALAPARREDARPQTPLSWRERCRG